MQTRGERPPAYIGPISHILREALQILQENSLDSTDILKQKLGQILEETLRVLSS